jgi:hypothetical protein
MARTQIEPGWTESLMPEREVFRARFSAAAMAAGIAAAYREALADAKPIGNPAVSSLS